MKGKKILALASILAGAAVIGATFASWAVTDNADPFGMKITPGTIHSETIDSVVLSYGEKVGFTNIEGLEQGKPQLAGSVGLKAVYTGNSSTYTGKLKMTLINQTDKQANEPLLIDYLGVDVYETAVTADEHRVVTSNLPEQSLGHIPTTVQGQKEYTTDVNIQVSNNTVKTVYIVVSLGNVDPLTLAEITNDVVYLQLDWNSNGTDEVQSSTVYAYTGTASKHVYAYAWSEGANAKNNGTWPGVAMKDEGNGLYSYELKLDFQKVIFSQFANEYVANAEPEKKSDDLTLSSTIRNTTPMYDMSNANRENWDWDALTTFETLTKDYYVVGTMNNWTRKEAFGMTHVGGESTEYKLENVQLAAGAKLKVQSKDGADWYGSANSAGSNGIATVEENGNVVIAEAGVYTIHFYTDGQNGNYVIITK